jgi:molybdopterin molybdotransferase
MNEPDWHSARNHSYDSAKSLDEIKLKLVNAFNYTLATPLITLHDLPPFDTSMMDGFAVCGRGPWNVVGTILAGAKNIDIKNNEAVAIATGAKVPPQAEAVIRHEHSELNNNILNLKADHNLVAGQDFRKQGEEAKKGTELLKSGTKVNPAVLGLAASCGLDELIVIQNPVIDVLILGDELLDSGLPIDGKIRDSLSMQIPGWIVDSDCVVGKIIKVSDDLEKTVTAIKQSTADIILTTGGTAKGPVDHIHPAIEKIGGKLVIDEVKVRPGHPMLLSLVGKNRFLVGLPGNPLAACVAFISLALPVIRKMQSRELEILEKVTVNKDVPAPKNEHRLFPVLTQNNQATPVEHWGSAMLRGVAISNGFVIVPPNGAKAGSILEFIKTPW